MAEDSHATDKTFAMRRRILTFLIYGLTALSLAEMAEAILNGEPINHFAYFVYAAAIGAALFGIASLTALFYPRVAVDIGILAAILAWPEIGLKISVFPWQSPGWAVRYRPFELAEIICLTVASIFTIQGVKTIWSGDMCSNRHPQSSP